MEQLLITSTRAPREYPQIESVLLSLIFESEGYPKSERKILGKLWKIPIQKKITR